jgi:hypothetical protein
MKIKDVSPMTLLKDKLKDFSDLIKGNVSGHKAQ